MRTVEITYRYGAADDVVRPKPLDANSARSRLDAGNRESAALLGGLAADNTITRRVVEVDSRDLGLDAGSNEAPRQRPFVADAVAMARDLNERRNKQLDLAAVFSASALFCSMRETRGGWQETGGKRGFKTHFLALRQLSQKTKKVSNANA
jgi:hypothetical protein